MYTLTPTKLTLAATITLAAIAIMSIALWAAPGAQAQTPSSDASLSALKLNLTSAGMTAVAISPEFETATKEYIATVFADSVKVTAATTAAGATLAVRTGATTFHDGAPTLEFGDNTITVAVTAADGRTTSDYTLTVTRLDRIWSGTVTVGENELGRGYSSAEIGMAGGSITSTAFTYGGVEYSVLGLGWVQALGKRGIYFSRVIPDDIRENWVVIIDGTKYDFAGKSTLPIYHSETNAFIADGYQWMGDSWDMASTFDAVLGSRNPPHDATLSELALTHSEGTAVDLKPATEPFAKEPNSYKAVVDVGITKLNVIAAVPGGATTEIVHGTYGTPAENGSITLEPDETTRITITVTSRDGSATQTHVIRVPRNQGEFIHYLLLPDEGGAPPRIQGEWMYATTVTADPSSDATLSALELTDIPLVFDPATLDYAADVSHEVARTTVTATPNDEGATYRVTLDGDADEDGTIELTVGQNAIAVVVTAEDGATARTYTATVTRGAPPTAAVKLSPSSPVTSGTEITVTMTFANLEYDDDRSTTDYVFRADVAGADECENQAGGYGLGIDRYMHRVDEDPEVRRGTISAACPAGDYSVEVALTSPDGGESASASADFSVVEPAPAPTPTATAAVELSPSGPVTAGTEVAVAMSFAKLTFDSNTADTDYLFRADVVGADGCEGNGMGVERYMYKVDQDPEVRSSTISTGCPAGDYTLMVSIWSPDNTEPASASADFSVVEPAPEPEPDPPALSADATLSSLALSSVTLAFDSDTTTYTASVGNDVAETTVSPTPNHAGASYVVKLDGVADGSVVLAVGENAISVVVTAEDGETTVIYTVTLTRAEAPAPPEPKPTGPPGVPDQPVGQVSGKGQVRLEWNDVAGAGSYDVRYFDGQWMELPAGGISIVFDGSEAQISGLKDWGVHYFSVRAVNGAGASEWSEYNTMRNGG